MYDICHLFLACADGDMRLMNGTEFVVGQMEGRVEVCSGNVYYSVCHDFFDALEANVVCRNLPINTSSMSITNELLV